MKLSYDDRLHGKQVRVLGKGERLWMMNRRGFSKSPFSLLVTVQGTDPKDLSALFPTIPTTQHA